MRKTAKWSVTASVLLLLNGIACSVLADDGQLSSWEDSNVLDYPAPPVGGWEPLVPVYNPADKGSAEAAKKDKKNPTTEKQATAAPAPGQYAPPAGAAYATPPAGPSYAAPAAPVPAPGYGQAWPPAVAPGYYRGYARPGYNRPAYPVPGYSGRVYTAPNTGLPGNHGNPWNSGIPGGWAATPWGELGPAGWVYPVPNAAPGAVNGAQAAPNTAPRAPNTSTMSGGFNGPAMSQPAPAGTEDRPDNTGNAASAPVQGFDWNVRD